MFQVGCESADVMPAGGDEFQTWEEFERSARIDPDVPGRYMVDGDIQVREEAVLRQFYEWEVQARSLVGAQINSDKIAIIDPESRNRLTYCVSSNASFDGFTDPGEHQDAVDAMALTTRRWERAADVNFIYDPSLDSNCENGNSGVYMAVKKYSGTGICGSSFFPGDSPAAREIYLRMDPVSCLSLESIAAHELSHMMGFRHEHDRKLNCNTDLVTTHRILSEYDNRSITHYHGEGCNGLPLASLSRRDVAGARFLYTNPKDLWRHGGTSQQTDFDGDGKRDIYFYRTEPNYTLTPPADVILYGDGSTPSLVTSVNAPTSRYMRPIAGDYDRDGLSDIYFYDQGTADDILFTKQGANDDEFTENALITIDDFHQPLAGYFFSQFESVATPDIAYYGPGPETDRQLAASPGVMAKFEWITATLGSWSIGDATRWYTPIAGDFDGDRDTDLFFYHADSDSDPSKLLVNPGTGFIVASPTNINHWSFDIDGNELSTFWYSHVVADFSADTKDDILFYAPGHDVVFLFGGASGPGTTDVTVADPDDETTFRPFAGDFDGDRDADVYWFNQTEGGDDIVWWMTGAGTFTATTVTSSVSGHHDRVPLPGNYDDNDGDDILWWKPLDGTLEFWTKGAGLTFDMTAVAEMTVQGYPVGYGLH